MTSCTCSWPTCRVRFNPDCDCPYPNDDDCPNYCAVHYGNWSVKQKREIMIEHLKNDTSYYNGSVDAWDVVNEALCDCTPMTYATCADYMDRASTASTKCGYSERYGVYLKRNVYWPDLPDYIELAFNEARKWDPNARLGYNE